MHCRFVLWNISRKIFSLNGPCWKFAFQWQWHCNAQCCSSMLLLLLLLLRAQWFYGQQNFLSSGQIWVATCNASSTTVDLLCGANATGRNTLEIVWSLFDFHDLYWAQQWSGHLDSSSSIQLPPSSNLDLSSRWVVPKCPLIQTDSYVANCSPSPTYTNTDWVPAGLLRLESSFPFWTQRRDSKCNLALFFGASLSTFATIKVQHIKREI